MISSERKRFRDRANRAARDLLKEKDTWGCISDGSGKRYRVGVYFLLAGELDKAIAAFDWFDNEFPDDGGEPIFYLYGALASYRGGYLPSAQSRLLRAMLSNIFLLPQLIGEHLVAPDIWYSSNWQMEQYIQEVDEFLDEPTAEERNWIASELDSETFKALRAGYENTYRALLAERDPKKRGAILSAWRKLQAKHAAKL